jgi:hypothetical protein
MPKLAKSRESSPISPTYLKILQDKELQLLLDMAKRQKSRSRSKENLDRRVQFHRDSSKTQSIANIQKFRLNRRNSRGSRTRSRSLSYGPSLATILRKQTFEYVSPPPEKKRKYKEMPEFDYSKPITSFKQLDKVPSPTDNYRNLDCKMLLKDVYNDVWKDVIKQRFENKDQVRYDNLMKKTKN